MDLNRGQASRLRRERVSTSALRIQQPAERALAGETPALTMGSFQWS
jgi:hypothetical protein